ncbi:hypothetical protein PFFCH_02371 [Plasmodium falciparum FCH/4]|uniref:Uncharacterized protein n=1 Tax=Plasmodium falciparum FCH/4 TaxID=1036724 RepID=A0A024VPH5_PLAFA|nr:hypothetical protein PFFCH_02371 [Plasmodium falciparum FCH/4]
MYIFCLSNNFNLFIELYKSSLSCSKFFPIPLINKKVKELNIEGSIHSDLREFYLSFADALLTKEEEKNDLFEFLKKSKNNI